MLTSLILTATVEVALIATSGGSVGVAMAKVYGPPETVICFGEWEALPEVTCWKDMGEKSGPLSLLEPFNTKVAPKETKS